jgi:hypothetical protein
LLLLMMLLLLLLQLLLQLLWLLRLLLGLGDTTTNTTNVPAAHNITSFPARSVVDMSVA